MAYLYFNWIYLFSDYLFPSSLHFFHVSKGNGLWKKKLCHTTIIFIVYCHVVCILYRNFYYYIIYSCVLSLISRRNIEIPTRINFNSPKKSLHHCCHNGLFLFLFNDIFMVFWWFITWFVILIVVLVWWSWIKRSSIRFDGRKMTYPIMKIKTEISYLLVLQ